MPRYVYAALLLSLCQYHCKPVRKNDEKFVTQKPKGIQDLKFELGKNKTLEINLHNANNELPAPLSFQIDEPSHGKLEGDREQGVVIYIPEKGFTGSESIHYRLGSDPQKGEALIEINVINHPPVAQSLEIEVAVDGLASLALVGVDADQDSLQYEIVEEPKQGTLQDVDLERGWVNYKPNPGFTGDDVLRYRVKDPSVTSEPGTITLHVGADEKDYAGTLVLIKNLKQNIQLPAPAGTLAFAILTPPQKATVEALDKQHGLLSLALTPGFYGRDEITYQVTDAKGTNTTLKYKLTVINRAPQFTSRPIYEHAVGQMKANEISLAATIRDFPSSHPDFVPAQAANVLIPGLVEERLDADHKPVFTAKDPLGLITSKESFAQWYRERSDTCMVPYAFVFPYNATTKKYHYFNRSFFPINNLCLGNEGAPNNLLFTAEFSTSFEYQPTAEMTFSSDDDLWIFIDGRLAVDLGGRHQAKSATIKLSELGPRFGLQAGRRYTLDGFYADRGPSAAEFTLETTTALSSTAIYQYQLAAHDADGDALTYRIVKGPSGLALDPSKGLLRWAPRLKDAGVHTISIAVDDGAEGKSEQEFLLQVKPES